MRDTCEELVAKFKARAKFSCAAYHAMLKPSERLASQARWKKGEIDVIVATISFGMGIDKANVESVVHWDLPKSLSAYFQESGRAGRSSSSIATCRMYFSQENVNLMNFIFNKNSAKDETKQ